MNASRRPYLSWDTLRRATINLLRNATSASRPSLDKAPAAPQTKGSIMKTIAKVIESMLTKDATQQWTGQTSAIASDGWGWAGYASDGWGWAGVAGETSTIF